jgi:hypothetical protein
MADLAEFLIARIAEDEAWARAAANNNGATWYMHDGSLNGGYVTGDNEMGNPRAYRGDTELWDTESGYLVMHADTAVFVARNDPGRMLAECEAKRRIVDQYRDAKHWNAAEWDNGYDDDGREYSDAIAETWETATRLLALPYADHPDYREEWRP